MASEARDPREAVLEDWRWELGRREPDADHPSQVLADLDAADPIRQLWPEVVEALGECEKNLRILHDAAGEEPDWDPTVRSTFEVWKDARDLLTRARAITPKGGDTP